MNPRDPFIDDLATFRGISYEAAAEQVRQDRLIEETESVMVTGRPLEEWSDATPLFQMAETKLRLPESIRRWNRAFFSR